MNSILTDLYYGRISPWERRPVRSAETPEINRKSEDEKRHLFRRCHWTVASVFRKNLYTQSSDTEQVNAFSCGFKLGAELMLAVFAESR